MFVVALTELPPITDDLVRDIAADIGIGAFDARLMLNAGAPCVALKTADADRATRLMRSLEARGVAGVMLDTATIVASADMVALRKFRFEPGGLVLEDADGATLPYDDVHAVLRATHRTTSETPNQTVTRSLNVTRTLVTGVVSISKKVTESTVRSEDKEQVVYLFRRSRETPWLVRESQVSFTALGAAMSPTRPLNFARLLAELRTRMHHARFDARLLTAKRIPERQSEGWPGAAAGRTSSSSSEGGVDLLAHVVAFSLLQESRSPYRQ